MASQWPSHPWWRPRSRPCGHTTPAQATSPDRFPPSGRNEMDPPPVRIGCDEPEWCQDEWNHV